MKGTTAGRIRKMLEERFRPERLEVIDLSRDHVGHAGAAAGGGHFRVRIVSRWFEGLSAIERHRSVYAALAIPTDPAIHALSIVARTPVEANPHAPAEG